MTIKDAILRSLDDMKRTVAYMDIYKHIISKKYYDFGEAKTPYSTVSALLGDFIRSGDSRVKRIKNDNGSYLYYLARCENNIEITAAQTEEKRLKKESYHERDLHKLLSTYLKSENTYSKTIFHEKSNGTDKNQKWVHPDMVGIEFSVFKSRASQNLLKTVNNTAAFKISSYEIKKEINSDTALKEAFFQTVSNSSWANFGYLAAFEFGDNLLDEVERLSKSFGIGVIKLKANPYESKILFAAKYRNLDFKTIDKLCGISSEFEEFIEDIEKLATADEKYVKEIKKEFERFCDDYLKNDTEIERYCEEKHIPTEE